MTPRSSFKSFYARIVTYSNKVNEGVSTVHLFSLLPSHYPPVPSVSAISMKFWPENVVEKCLRFQRWFYWKHQSCYWSLIYLEQRTLNLLKYRIGMITIKMYKIKQKIVCEVFSNNLSCVTVLVLGKEELHLADIAWYPTSHMVSSRSEWFCLFCSSCNVKV